MRTTSNRRLRMAALALTLTLAPAPLAACTPEKPAPAPTVDTAVPIPRTTFTPAAVKALCDFFEARPHEVLLTAAAEGNVTDLREADGVPRPLGELARLYYDGEALTGAGALSAGRRARLDDKYAGVIRSCEAYGWRAS